MIDNKQLEKSLEVAMIAHKGATRRNGDPYIFHPLRVANNYRYIWDKRNKVIAILHDVIEDSDFTEESLLNFGIEEEIIDVVKILTRTDNISYEIYIDNICKSVPAMLVKLSDLEDNSDTSTLARITSKDIERFQQYEKAKLKINSTLLEYYPEIFKRIAKNK